MIAVLKERIVPELKARGFKGAFPHFRRLGATSIHLITFQFDKLGGGFVVEVASCPPQGATMHWGEVIPPSKVTAHHISKRLRLGRTEENTDHWFRYDKRSLLPFGNAYERAALELRPYIETQAEEYWRAKDAAAA